MEIWSWVAVVVLGGIVAVDGASVGQFMLARPLVAATLAGWLAGAPAAGAVAGLILEALQLNVFPAGATRTPESGPAAAVAGATYAGFAPSGASLLTATLFALAWEWVGGASVHRMRELNAHLAATGDGPVLSPARLERNHLLAAMLDFARGALLTGVGTLLLQTILDGLEHLPEWPDLAVPARTALALSVPATVAGVLGLLGRERWRPYAAGAAVGLLLLLLRAAL